MDIARARWHVEQGERHLAMTDEAAPAHVKAVWSARAQAHFAASMAITNLLLTDPAEMPEPLEL